MNRMNTKQQASLLRTFRSLHRYTGALLFFFFFWIAVSGLFLGWKKHSGGAILPSTQRGTSHSLTEWMPVDELASRAIAALEAADPEAGTTIDRMDLRPGKGVVKVRFEGHHTEVQVDGATGEVLQMATRHSDWLEALHDGSIVERPLGIGGGYFKLIYTTIMALALLIFTITGFWLWYGPKRLRAAKRHRKP
jgi:uncharacterized iron-regulated membrane protein